MASFPISGRNEPDLGSKQAERRVQRRLFWPGTAVLRILPYGPDVLGVLLDLSESGCGVEIGIGIPAQVGAQVEVELNVRGVTLARSGVIRYIDVIRRGERETRAGIEFIEPCSRRAAVADSSVKGVLRQIDRDRPAGR
jgi:PilZ domain